MQHVAPPSLAHVAEAVARLRGCPLGLEGALLLAEIDRQSRSSMPANGTRLSEKLRLPLTTVHRYGMELRRRGLVAAGTWSGGGRALSLTEAGSAALAEVKEALYKSDSRT